MKDIRISLMLGMRLTASIFLLSVTVPLLAESDSEVITAIILINRQAELVDMDEEGEILKRYVAIPDYFTSGRSHQSSLRQSLRLIKDYGLIESFILPGSSDLPAACLQSFMLTYKRDANHQKDIYSHGEMNSEIFSDLSFNQDAAVLVKKSIGAFNKKSLRIQYVLIPSPHFNSVKNRFVHKIKQRKISNKRLYHSDTCVT